MRDHELKSPLDFKRLHTLIQKALLISFLASYFSFGLPVTAIQRAEATVSTANLILNVDGRNNSSYSGTGSSWTDLSGSGNNLTLGNAGCSGSLPSWNSSVGGGSFQLSVGNSCFFKSSLSSAPQNFSLFFWIKPTAFPATGGFSYLAQLGRDPNWIDGEYMFGFNPEGRLYFWDYKGGVFGYGALSDASSTKLTLNEWQYVGFVKNGANASFYIGKAGTLSNVGNPTGTSVTYENRSFAIGLDYRDASSLYRGYIGAIHYYRTNISAATATSNFTATSRGVPALVSSSVISGTTTYGSSLSASTGTWNNTPTSFSYQWSRASTISGSYSAISGATSSSYSLSSLDVGKYLKVAVTATNGDGSTTDTSTASAVIAAKPLTIKAADRTTTYTGSSAVISNSYSISGGLVGSDTFTSLTYTFNSLSPSYNSTTAPTNAGNYTITPSAAGFTVGSASSYSITYETGTLTINRATQSAFSLSSLSGTFLTNLQLTTSGGSDTGTVSFTVSAAGTANCSLINSESLTSTSAGNCQVVATKLGTTNYLPAYDTKTITVNKAALTFITSAAASLKYGSTTTASYTASRSLGTAPIPNLNGTFRYETSATTACNIDSSSGVVTMNRASGTCNVRVSLVDDTNYVDTSSALVSITPALADALVISAGSDTTVYSGSEAAITPSYSISGLKFSDTVTVTYGYSGTTNAGTSYSFSATKPTAAGVYSIIPAISISNSDSYTASTSVTNGTLTISRATRTLSPTTYSKTTLKYGESATVTSNLTSPSSNSDGTFLYVVGSGCSINSSTGEITANTYTGSCLETTTVTQGNNFETATATAITFMLGKADTLTVTTATPNALAYTGSAAAVTPTITVSGLVAGNTATGATFNYSRAPNCASGGTCQVGDTGPGGGKVFYVSGSTINAVSGISSGGIYLEMAPATFSKNAFNWCEGQGNPYTTLFGATATTIGSGAANTKIMIDNCTGGAGVEAVNLTLGGKSDWFLPSYGELVEIYSQRDTLGLGSGEAAAGYLYWSSTEVDTWIASSLVPWAGVGGYNKGMPTPYLPIRAFSASVLSYGPSGTAPTNSGSYGITPSLLTLAGGITTDYYVATVYETATLTINKAAQVAFTNYSTLSGVFGSGFTIYKFGGSGDGEEILSVSNGTALGCALNGTVLTATTAGTCLITASKATSENYLQTDSSFTVYLYYFVPETPVPAPVEVPKPPAQIVVVVVNSWSAQSTIGPTITSISPASGPVGTVVTITGTGMDGVDVIKIARKNLTSVTGISSTSVSGIIPAGAISGPILVQNSVGSHFVVSGFTVTP